MKVSEQLDYRFARAVLRDDQFAEATQEMFEVLESVEVPVYPLEKVKVRPRSNQIFPADQKGLNKLLDKEFVDRGWERQPLIVPPEGAGPDTGLLGDFRKLRIGVEVQFGNMSRWAYDVFKFQLSYSLGHIDIGVLILPTRQLSNYIDENVAHFERVARELPSAKMSLTLPILVLGLDANDYTFLEERIEEKRSSLQA